MAFQTFEQAGYAPGGSPRKGRRKSAKKPATPKPAPRLPKPAPIQARPAVVQTPPSLAPLSEAETRDRITAALSPLLPYARKAGLEDITRGLDHVLNLAMAGDSPYRLVEAGKETV